jgi:NADH-quinone oxidoreductase subunit M
MLSLSWLVPLAGAILLLLIPNADGRRNSMIRWLALAISVAGFAVTLAIWARFDTTSSEFQLVERMPWIPAFGIDYYVGVDGISLLLVVLTGFLTPIALLSSWEGIEHKVKEFSMLILALDAAMIGVFISLDLFLFYVFWDAMLIPMYFLIGVWGYDQRIYAAVKFMLYTMAGSVLMLIAILALAYMYSEGPGQGSYTFDLVKLYTLQIAPQTQNWLFLAFAIAFAIKVPLFPFHTWLPDAHVQAPTAGSIILAGILLKLGVYGYLRFALPLFPDTAMHYGPWLGVLGVIGVVYGAFVAFAQHDMKRLVAYSSVSHLGLVVIGVGAFTTISLQGSILQMVNHGLSTGALFLLVGVLYERRHTREISAYGGVAGVVPVTTALFVIATLSSIGLPGLNGFVGEFLILLGTWTSPHRWWAVAAATGVILSAIYMLTLVQRVFWNPLTHEENKAIPEIRWSEFVAAAVLVVLMVWIGVRPNDVLDRLRVSVDALQEAVAAKQLATKSVYGGAP